MKSIDNLREYALTAASVNATTRAVLAGYIDEIERDVAELTDERDMLKKQWEAGVDFDQRLEACAENREDVTLFGVDYTPLPVDAEGVPIHVGDAMEADNGTTFEVEHISLYPWGWRCVGEGTDRSGVTCTAHAIPDGCRHHRAPTVEDVLREMLDAWGELPSNVTNEAIVAEYAAKLRLAGDE